MELVRQSRLRLQVPQITIPFKLPRYVWMMLSVLLGNLLMVAAVTALTRFSQPPSNPFSTYADISPGLPRSAVETRGFVCPSTGHDDAFQDLWEGTCLLWPEAGAFSQVEVVISGDMILHIAFTIRENTLRVGDLMMLWGMPEVRKYSHLAVLSWRSRGVYALASNHTGQFSLFLPVWRVYIASTEK